MLSSFNLTGQINLESKGNLPLGRWRRVVNTNDKNSIWLMDNEEHVSKLIRVNLDTNSKHPIGGILSKIDLDVISEWSLDRHNRIQQEGKNILFDTKNDLVVLIYTKKKQKKLVFIDVKTNEIVNEIRIPNNVAQLICFDNSFDNIYLSQFVEHWLGNSSPVYKITKLNIESKKISDVEKNPSNNLAKELLRWDGYDGNFFYGGNYFALSSKDSFKFYSFNNEDCSFEFLSGYKKLYKKENILITQALSFPFVEVDSLKNKFVFNFVDINSKKIRRVLFTKPTLLNNNAQFTGVTRYKGKYIATFCKLEPRIIKVSKGFKQKTKCKFFLFNIEDYNLLGTFVIDLEKYGIELRTNDYGDFNYGEFGFHGFDFYTQMAFQFHEQTGCLYMANRFFRLNLDKVVNNYKESDQYKSFYATDKRKNVKNEFGGLVVYSEDNKHLVAQYLISNPLVTQVEAEKTCSDLVYNGFKDWYLPNKDELKLVYENRLKFNGSLNEGVYVSSTRTNDYYSLVPNGPAPYSIDFYDGEEGFGLYDGIKIDGPSRKMKNSKSGNANFICVRTHTIERVVNHNPTPRGPRSSSTSSGKLRKFCIQRNSEKYVISLNDDYTKLVTYQLFDSYGNLIKTMIGNWSLMDEGIYGPAHTITISWSGANRGMSDLKFTAQFDAYGILQNIIDFQNRIWMSCN